MIIPKAKTVKNTKIFCASLKDNTRQVTVYQNEVGLKNPAAMILPVPSPAKVRLLDLSSYESIFQDLEDEIDPPKMGDNEILYNSKSLLKVLSVGSYQVSIAPSLSDLNRLDQNVFKIKGDLKSLLENTYPSSWGFVVCIMRKEAKFHPIGYISNLTNGKLFVPTKHYHGHVEENPDWDHEIYLYNSISPINGKIGLRTKTVPLDNVPINEDKLGALLTNPRNLSKMTIDQSFQGNKDFLISI